MSELRDRLHAVLRDAAKDRWRQQCFTHSGHGTELAWVISERSLMLGEINAWRRERWLPPVTIDEVLRMEQSAAGHADYAETLVDGCVQLALKGTGCSGHPDHNT